MAKTADMTEQFVMHGEAPQDIPILPDEETAILTHEGEAALFEMGEIVYCQVIFLKRGCGHFLGSKSNSSPPLTVIRECS